MDYLGLFCLGAFVGTIATLGVHALRQPGVQMPKDNP